MNPNMNPRNLPPLTEEDIQFALISQRKRFKPSKEQVVILESYFESRVFLRPNDAEDLSRSLNVPVKTIRLWFQNRRAKERRRIQMKQAIQMKQEMYEHAGLAHGQYAESITRSGMSHFSSLDSPTAHSSGMTTQVHSTLTSPEETHKETSQAYMIPIPHIPQQQENMKSTVVNQQIPERPVRTTDSMKLSNLLD